METQLVTDYTGEPVAMVVNYKEWVKIAKQLHIPVIPAITTQERNPLDWYRLTESLNSVLNGVIAFASREHMKEMDKIYPNQQRVDEMVSLRNEVMAINKNSLNFKDLERMEELIAKYSPILKKEAAKDNGLKR